MIYEQIFPKTKIKSTITFSNCASKALSQRYATFWQLGQIKLCENVGLACIYGYEHLAHNLVSVHNIKSVLLYTLNYKIVLT